MINNLIFHHMLYLEVYVIKQKSNKTGENQPIWYDLPAVGRTKMNIAHGTWRLTGVREVPLRLW